MGEYYAKDAERGEAAEPLSVSAAMSMAKQALESVTVRLVGEVSELSVKPGYKAVYFTIKDERASLPCMMWNSRYQKAGVEMRIGQLVELTGRFTLYEAKGRMSFDVFSISLAGEGDLRMRVAALAKKLEDEGLMDPRRKKPIPVMPEKIGLVTSPRGAVVHDVLRTLRRRFPSAHVYLAGVPVDGPGAAQGIIQGMREVYKAKVEVIVICRGGGSFEDFMPFNDEALARAIAACPTPVVTGIGHEPDTCIADMVADLRASTPTHAAMAISPSQEDLESVLDMRARALYERMSRKIERCEAQLQRSADRPLFTERDRLFSQVAQTLDIQSDRLTRAIPAALDRDAAALSQARARLMAVLPLAVQQQSVRLDAQVDRMRVAGDMSLKRFEQDVRVHAARLHDLSPLAVLGRGYAMARNESGAIVKSVEQAPPGSSLGVTVADGVLDCVVRSVVSAGDEPGRTV